jgi:hypothetical protein
MQDAERRANRALFTWSNLVFALVLALVIWLVHCCVMGATRYSLRLTVREQAPVSGVVRMPPEAEPLVCGVTYRLGEAAGGRRGIGHLEYDRRAGGACYEAFIPVSEVYAESAGRHWRPSVRRRFDRIAVSIEAPLGWHVRPQERVIRGPTTAADFTVARDEQ